MKRKTGQQLAARRREVANLAQKGWTQAAVANHLKIPQGTVSRDLAAICRIGTAIRGIFPKSRGASPQTYAPNDHFDALQGPFRASARIIVELCVSPSCVRAFRDFPKYASAEMEIENQSGGTTQVTARQAEAALSDGSR